MTALTTHTPVQPLCLTYEGPPKPQYAYYIRPYNIRLSCTQTHVKLNLKTCHTIDWDSATCFTYSTDYYQQITLERWFTKIKTKTNKDYHLTLKMASAQVVETSVASNSPSQDSNRPDDLFHSRYIISSCKPFWKFVIIPVDSNLFPTCLRILVSQVLNEETVITIIKESIDFTFIEPYENV